MENKTFTRANEILVKAVERTRITFESFLRAYEKPYRHMWE